VGCKSDIYILCLNLIFNPEGGAARS